MRGVSLVGVSQSEVGINSNSNSNSHDVYRYWPAGLNDTSTTPNACEDWEKAEGSRGWALELRSELWFGVWELEGLSRFVP